MLLYLCICIPNAYFFRQMAALRKRWLMVFLVGLSIYILYFVIDTLPNIPNTKQSIDPKKTFYTVIDQWKDKHHNKKIIAWYVGNFASMAGHSTVLNLSYCSFKNCRVEYIFSENGIKPSKPFDADAIIVLGTSILKLPPPPRRDEDQVFVLAVRDAAGCISHSRSHAVGRQWMDTINWTMTYRLDSDIVYKYSSILKRHIKNNFTEECYDEIFRKKERDVAWFVSHCHTKSRREDYVAEFNGIIDVDIYGGCGMPSCGKGDHSCFDDIATKYKFYLAFENTFYDNYVTEKLFTWFDRNIITVVRGGSNYSKIVPPGTVIDASEFKSAVELAQYLKKVATDKQLYLSYLKRKDNYFSTKKLLEAFDANCKLCEYLNTLNYHRKTYSNISEWWSRNRQDHDSVIQEYRVKKKEGKRLRLNTKEKRTDIYLL